MSGDDPERDPQDGDAGERTRIESDGPDEDPDLVELTAEIADAGGDAVGGTDEHEVPVDGSDASAETPVDGGDAISGEPADGSDAISGEPVDENDVAAGDPTGSPDPVDDGESDTDEVEDGPDSAGEPSSATGGATDANADRESVAVQVRPNLLSAWERQADRAKLDLSAYVVRMVEAGRMSVNMQPAAVEDVRPSMTVEEVAAHIESELEREDYVSWEALVDTLVEDLEATVEEALAELQAAGVVRYSGLHGGYRLAEDGE